MSFMNRKIWNISMFILSFTLSNFISGIIYDTYVNYLHEVNLEVATSFWSYYGYATFISAFLLLLIPKIGYKKTLFLCPITCIFALVAVLYLKIPAIYSISSLLSLVGLQLHYAILAPFIAAYTTEENKTKWYSRTYYIGYSGWLITTYLGGMFTVQRFASRLGVSLSKAKDLTKFLDKLLPQEKSTYLLANKDVLFLTLIISIISIFPIFFLKENIEDFQSSEEKIPLKIKFKNIISSISNKYALFYIIYWSLISFGMGLFTPYYTVFLNRTLHIDKATSSLLLSISYIALVIFMIFTEKVVKKYGQIVTLGGVSILAIPFMLIIANGNSFGKYMIPAVGVALFFRCGLMNLGYPVDSSLPMELVKKELRPAYSSLIFIISGLASILSGWYTKNFLFVTQNGYKSAYYVAGAIYLVASIMLFIIFFKKYNRSNTIEEVEVNKVDLSSELKEV